MRGNPELVSVIVPARNAAGTLTQQLDAIGEQDYAGPFELIVAVNGCSDGTAELAEGWIRRRGFGRIVHAQPGRGPGYTRNRGAAAAVGDLLAFCDADDVVSPAWLGALAAEAECADVVTGPHGTELLNEAPIRSCQSVPPPGQSFLGFMPMASTSNCAVWREVFWDLGGFEEHTHSGEDVSFSWRAQLRGFDLSVADLALVHKRFRPNRLAIAPQYFRHGIGDAWLYSRFRSSGMPRRSGREALREWGAIARGLPAEAGAPGRWGRVVQRAALACGRVAGSLRYRVLFL
jgi:glycosyltransferase involved in cell wall biosynthesis